MDDEAQAVLFNAVPLLLVAVLYFGVGARRHTVLGRPLALALAALGVAAAVAAAAILATREPLAGQPLISVVPILLGSIPAFLAARWNPASGSAAAPVERSPLSQRLLDLDGEEEIAVALADELTDVFELDVANLALVEDGGRRARLVAAREGGEHNESLRGMELDLEREASGISTVAREGAAFSVFDAESSPIVNQRLNRIARVKSCAFVPMLAGGEVVGVVFAAVRQPRLFEEEELAHMQRLAAEAGLALARTRTSTALTTALERERRQAQVERGFYRIAAVLSEPLSAGATHDAVAQAAAEALGADSAAVLRAVGDALALAGSYGLAEPLTTYLQSESDTLAQLARSGKLLTSRDLEGDNRFDEGFTRAAAASNRRSLLVVPLPEPSGLATGLVLVFFAAEEVLHDEQLALAERVAGAARGALERSELYERERRSRSLAQRLARAGRELAGELDPDDVLELAVRHAKELLMAVGSSARMLEGDEVVVRAANGVGGEEVIGTSAPSTGFLVGDIVQTRSTHALADVRTDDRVVEADAMLGVGYAAYLGVPMIGPEESVQGILAVYDARPRQWREEEVDALHALGAAAAAARANAELYQGVRHEQQRSQAILANVADGIVAVDREGRVVLWNPAAERVTGVLQSEALGRTPMQVLGRPLEGGDGILGGSRLVPIRRAGEEVWLSLSEAVMTDPAGAVAGRIYAFRDISAERSVEQMKTDFVSTVSHELRTPLTSIYGFAETLLRQDVLFGEEERATFLRYIASESERLTAIVDRLLSVAQLDTGDMAVQVAETDVAAVVSEAVRSLGGPGESERHRFVVELADGPLAAEADSEKLGQVLGHLLDNAVRYSPEGGTVTVAARRRDGAVEVSVEDEGIGIPHNEQERIFRKFYRGDSAAAVVGVGAAGLGLFLAERLVTAMGGRIRVESDEGRGSTFVLELPTVESET